MLDSSQCRTLTACDKRDGQCQTFTGAARVTVGLQVFGRVRMLYMCVKTIKAVTATRLFVQ